MSRDEALTARAAMLIRRPVAEVFEAFVDPAVTSQFWFTDGSGRLEAGRRVTWRWRMYGASVQVDVKAVEPNRRILVEWSGEGESPTAVEWLFTARDDGTTFVRIANRGFRGEAAESRGRRSPPPRASRWCCPRSRRGSSTGSRWRSSPTAFRRGSITPREAHAVREPGAAAGRSPGASVRRARRPRLGMPQRQVLRTIELLAERVLPLLARDLG